jgi:integrase
MGARVRVDRRTNRLYLDLHVRGRRRRIFSELPATPRNTKILEAKAETIEREVFLGTFDPAKHFASEERKQRVTVERVYEEWRRKKANDVSALTLEWYTEMVEGKILPTWRNRRLDELTPIMFDQFKASLLAQNLAPRTMNIVLGRLKEMLRFAQDRGYVGQDLAHWVVFQRQRPTHIEPLNFDEKAQLLKAFPVRWQPYFEVAFGTGLRPSEQIALRWERIDWGRNVIHIVEGWREGRLTTLKVASAHREVDILPPVRKALERQRLVAGGSELVFPNSRGTHINDHNLRRRVWYPALVKAKLKPLDLYNTRHTFATHALASGEDPGWVAKMLGHTTLQMLITRYYRYVPNLTRRDGSLLAKQLKRVPHHRAES